MQSLLMHEVMILEGDAAYLPAAGDNGASMLTEADTTYLSAKAADVPPTYPLTESDADYLTTAAS